MPSIVEKTIGAVDHLIEKNSKLTMKLKTQNFVRRHPIAKVLTSGYLCKSTLEINYNTFKEHFNVPHISIYASIIK